jgi:hypothetical protein
MDWTKANIKCFTTGACGDLRRHRVFSWYLFFDAGKDKEVLGCFLGRVGGILGIERNIL